MIVFIPCSALECNPVVDHEWLPRTCPACHQIAIVGHGRRRRLAHDGVHDWIRVRRGRCQLCHLTVTVLPGWCVPHAPYTLLARQQACDRLAQGASAEQAAPHCRSPDRLPDAATIRRWAWRRIHSLRLCWRFAPTLLAWDFGACARILIAEPNSP